MHSDQVAEKEQTLFDTRTEILRLRDAYEHTLAVLRRTSAEFTSLVRSFANLGKCAEEFDDQQLRGTLEGEAEDGRGQSFGLLKRVFNFSGERFELLALEYAELSRNAESALHDATEVLGVIDEFIRGKDELLRRLEVNVGGDGDLEGDDPTQTAYLALLTGLVEDAGAFWAQSGECLERVLGESQDGFRQRIHELVGNSEAQ